MFTQTEYDRGDAIAISWHIDDVKAINENLTDDQAREVLARFADHHEGSMESMWEDLKYHTGEFIHDRLENIRKELRAERISYGELAELQDLKDSIADDDVELLEAAGVPEGSRE